MNRATRCTTSVVAFLAVSISALAADKPAAKPQAWLDPADAPPAFAVQGEYRGEEAGEVLAAQVAALGNGTFRATFLPGGLPGDGWDGKTRVQVMGGSADPAGGKTVFPPPDPGAAAPPAYTATADGEDALKVTRASDKRTFVLKKVNRTSPTLGAKPPEGAIVLFDGKNADAWNNGKVDPRGLLSAGAATKQAFKGFTLHIEFILPFKPEGRDQDRGNSGIYIQNRYEVQVLDSFGEAPTFNGCASLYRQKPADLNMCYPPLSWQTYDIDFTPPQFDESGKKTKNAVITVKHNGVAVHDQRELTSKTGAGKAEGPEAGHILLQGHGNPVFYRNIWIVER